MSTKSTSQLNVSELFMASGVVWKILIEELVAQDSDALKRMKANLIHARSASEDFESLAGVKMVLDSFASILESVQPFETG